jgi:hypothetical protein
MSAVAADETPPDFSPAPCTRKRDFQIFRDDEVPAGALTWAKRKDFDRLERLWRDAVIELCGTKARNLRLGWVLVGLVEQDGFCRAQDPYLCKATTMETGSVQKALVDLVARGLLIRGHVPLQKGGTQRRLFLSLPASHKAADILRNGVCPDTPFRRKVIRRNGGTDSSTHSLRQRRGLRIATTMEAAEADARRRAARAQGTPAPAWYEDPDLDDQAARAPGAPPGEET